MTPRTILCYLDVPSDVDRLVDATARVAARDVGNTPALVLGTHASPSLAIHGGPADVLASDIVTRHVDAQRAITERLRTRFLEACGERGLEGRWTPLASDGLGEGIALRELARGADLVVLPQPTEDDRSRFVELAVREIVTRAARPVLVIPRVGDVGDIGRTLLIGWTPTGEATRAAYDALALARPGAHATLLRVSHAHDEHPEIARSARALAEALERHGLDCALAHWSAAEIPVGDALLNEAFERGADLLVCGAYGHSRLHDLVRGATTTHLLRHMTVPVLFSH